MEGDTVMLLKLGVDISRLSRPMRKGLNTIQRVFAEWNEEPVITSTYEGSHSPGSLHYENNAIDLRLAKKISHGMAVKLLKEALGKDFDVIYEKNHYHVEYDPK